MEFIPLQSVKLEPEEEPNIAEENDLILVPEVSYKAEVPEESEWNDSSASVKEKGHQEVEMKDDDEEEEEVSDHGKTTEGEFSTSVKGKRHQEVEMKDDNEEEEEVSDYGKTTGGEFVLVQSEESNLDLDSNNEDENWSDSNDRVDMAEGFGAHFLSPMIQLEEGVSTELESAIENPDYSLETRMLRGGRIRIVHDEEDENDELNCNEELESEGTEEEEEEQNNIISSALSNSASINAAQLHKCDFCQEGLPDSLLLIFHINEKHSDKCIISKEQIEKAVKSTITDNDKKKKEGLNKILPGNVQCPMCSCIYVTKIGLEKHLIAFHDVKNVDEVFKSVSKSVTAKNKKIKKRRKRYCSASSSDEDSQDDFFLPGSSSSSEDEDPTWTLGTKQKRSRTKCTASSSSNSDFTQKSLLSGVPGHSITSRPPTGVLQKLPTTGLKPLLGLKPESLLKMKSAVNAKLNLFKNESKSEPAPGQQKLKLYMSKDGNLRLVGGLLPGQQLVTMPDGTMKIVFTPQLPVPGTLTPVNLDSLPEGVSPECIMLNTTASKLLSQEGVPSKNIVLNTTMARNVPTQNPILLNSTTKSLNIPANKFRTSANLPKIRPSILRHTPKFINLTPASSSASSSDLKKTLNIPSIVIERNITEPEIISQHGENNTAPVSVKTTNLAKIPKSVPILVPDNSQASSIVKSSLFKSVHKIQNSLSGSSSYQSFVDLTDDNSCSQSSNESNVQKICVKPDGVSEVEVELVLPPNNTASASNNTASASNNTASTSNNTASTPNNSASTSNDTASTSNNSASTSIDKRYDFLAKNPIPRIHRKVSRNSLLVQQILKRDKNNVNLSD